MPELWSEDKMKIEWIKNDWFSTTLIISCENCGAKFYNDVYTFHMTRKEQETEAKAIGKMLGLKSCPKCKRKFK